MTWTKNSATEIYRKFSSWESDNGWTVQHCGHPTALWPYSITDPTGAAPIVSFNGHGFQTAEAARSAAEWLANGEAQIRIENGIALVNRVTAMGKYVNDPRNGLTDPLQGMTTRIPGLSSWILYDPQYIDPHHFAAAILQDWKEKPADYWSNFRTERIQEIYLAAGGRIQEPKPHSAGRRKKKPQPTKPPSSQADLFAKGAP